MLATPHVASARPIRLARMARMSLLLSLLIAVAAHAQASPATPPEAPATPPRPIPAAQAPDRPTFSDPSKKRLVAYGDSADRIRTLAQRVASNPTSEAEPPRQIPQADAPDAADSDSAKSVAPLDLPAAKTPLFGDTRAQSLSHPAASSPSPDMHEDASSRSGFGASSWILDTLAALGIVVGIVLLARWAHTRLGGRVTAATGNSPVEVLSRTAIAPRNHVVLLKVGRRIIVAGDSPAGLRALTEIVEPDEVAQVLADTAVTESTSIRRGFGQLMGRLNRDYDAAERVAQEGGDDSEHLLDRARDQLSALTSRVRAARISEEA